MYSFENVRNPMFAVNGLLSAFDMRMKFYAQWLTLPHWNYSRDDNILFYKAIKYEHHLACQRFHYDIAMLTTQWFHRGQKKA